MKDTGRRALGAGLATLTAMLGWHVALYPYRDSLSGTRRWVSYVIGVGTLLGGFRAWARPPAHREPVGALAVITACSGGADIRAWWWRARQRDK